MVSSEEMIKKLQEHVSEEIDDSDWYLEMSRSAELMQERKIANLLKIISDEEMCHSKMLMKCLSMLGVEYDHKASAKTGSK